MIKYLLLLSLLIFSNIIIFAQVKTITRAIPTPDASQAKGKAPLGGYHSEVKFSNSACMSADQQQEMQRMIDMNREKLNHERPGLLAKTSSVHPTFIWPTQAKAGFTDYSYYTVQFQVDHNLTLNNNLLDYNCGNRTYDWNNGNHAGTDIVLWPYAWRRMDEQVMEVIAAAPGVIVNKVDGNFDRNCVNNGAGTWNAIHVQHTDGSVAWYLHFKSGSLTAKGVGDNVALGEFLGTAGSSGSSSWPHLHFQVMDSLNNVIDPYQGNCNGFNADTWWTSQQAYNVPSVNRICTKKTESYYYDCPNPELLDEADTFNIGDSLWLWIYTRDMELNSNMQINLKDPNGQTQITFPFTVPWPTNPTTYVRWYYLVDAWWTLGWWTFEVVYGGNTYQHQFYMTNTTVDVNELNNHDLFSISPNPAGQSVLISNKSFADAELKVFDVVGHEIYSAKMQSDDYTFQTSDLASGVYLVQLSSENKTETRKLIVQH